MFAQQIKVAIADDHKIFRDGIKMSLKDRDFLNILWEAEDGKDLMHKLKLKQPDVLLMDIRMPEIDGVNAIGILRKEYEEVKIIVLTMYDDQEMITKMMEMGANAYLTKTSDPDEIRDGNTNIISAVDRDSAGLFTVTIDGTFPLPEKLVSWNAEVSQGVAPTQACKAHIVVDSYSQVTRTFQIQCLDYSTPSAVDPDDDDMISWKLRGSVQPIGTD